MEVHFTPEAERKLSDLAVMTGRSADELLEDALAGYSAELAQTRAMLDRRYDEIKDGKVQLIDGEEAFAQLRKNIEARRTGPA
jgi:hypothetical protein